MNIAVVRPIVVLAMVTACWSQVPAAMAAKGGHHAAGKPSSSAGLTVGKDGRTTVFSRTESDLTSGSVSVLEIVDEYDSLGLLVHETRTESLDGVVTFTEETAYSYGQAHRISRAVIVTDPDGAGPLPPSTRVDTLTRNNRHELTSIVTSIDEDSDGVIDRTSTETRGFDQRGRVIATRVEDSGTVTTTAVTYDPHGNVTSSTTDVDDLSTPQSPDFRDASTATFSGPHDLIDRQTDQQFTFDAVGDAQLQSSDTTTFSRTNRGSLTGSVEMLDSDGDGHVDLTAISTATYDNQDNILATGTTVHDGADVYEARQVYTNDKAGNPVEIVATETLNGALLDSSDSVATYDRFGRMVRSVESRDTDGDGNVDTIETFVPTYDSKDRIVHVVDTVTDGAGVLLFSRTSTTVYGKSTSTDTDEYDDNGDGTIDRRVVTVIPL